MHDRLAPGELFCPPAFVCDLMAELARHGQPMFPAPAFHRALAFAVDRDTSRYITNRFRQMDAAQLCACSQTSEIAPWEPTGDIHRNPPSLDHFWTDSHSATPDVHVKTIQRHRREALAQKRAAAAGAPVAVATKRL